MMRTVSLSDICTKITSGGTPLTKRDNYYGGGIPWLRTQEVNFGNIYSTEKTITELGLKNSSAKIIPKDSVIVAMYGATAGKSAINKIPLATNQACCNLIIDNSKADYRFVYYYLVNSYEKLLSAAVGAAQQNLGSKQISAMTINLPPLNQQKKIANILGSLDEKIELNRRMNETLEQLGQALFRHYFVDNPEAKNWESGRVSDVVRIYSGFAFKSKDFDVDGRYGLVTIKNVQDGSFIKDCTDHLSEPLPDKTPEHVHLKSGDIVLSLTGNVGRVCAVVGRDYLLNQRVAKLVGDGSQAYTYFLFRSKIMKGRMVGISKGTAQKNLSPIETGKLKIKIPPTNIMGQFEEIAINLLNMIVSNNEQSQTLTGLRDSLLPKLISGDIEA